MRVRVVVTTLAILASNLLFALSLALGGNEGTWPP